MQISNTIHVYAEIGIGNPTLCSTEYEYRGREHRIPVFATPTNITGFYIRLWVWKTVFIVSTNNWFEITHKNRRRIKLVFGIKGENTNEHNHI